jgi:hypothetical protein
VHELPSYKCLYDSAGAMPPYALVENNSRRDEAPLNF